jgi:hypothetical protein
MKNLIFILLILFVACSPQKRLQRLIRKHPELVATDTVKLSDTVISEHIELDTIFILNPSGKDTIILREKNVLTRIYRHIDTLKVFTEVQPDTVIITREVINNKVKIIHESKWDKWVRSWGKWILIGLVICLILFLIASVLRAFRR